jgi:L-iditol 2-dehydrogenase
LYMLEEVSTELKNDFRVGDKVIVAPAIGCGHCANCKKGRTNMCDQLSTIGFEFDGTFADYCAIPRQAFKMKNVIKIDGSIKDVQACVVEPIACAINGQSFLDIKPGENVLIFGAGFLGCIHAELALLKGAGKVIIAEISSQRRELAQKAIPGIYVIDAAETDLAHKLTTITDGAGCDVAITACPVGKTHSQSLEIINKGGRISLFGGLAGESKGFLDSNLIHYKEIGVFGVHASTPQHNMQALKLIIDGDLNPMKYLSVFSFGDIEKAFDALTTENAVKAVLRL